MVESLIFIEAGAGASEKNTWSWSKTRTGTATLLTTNPTCLTDILSSIDQSTNDSCQALATTNHYHNSKNQDNCKQEKSV